MGSRFVEEYGGYYLVEDTGDVLEYAGEILTDYHKGEYDSEYIVVVANKFILNDRIASYELRDENSTNRLTLTKLPKDLDIKTMDVATIRLLYGKKTN